jgi:hypothetical protein
MNNIKHFTGILTMFQDKKNKLCYPGQFNGMEHTIYLGARKIKSLFSTLVVKIKFKINQSSPHQGEFSGNIQSFFRGRVRDLVEKMVLLGNP